MLERAHAAGVPFAWVTADSVYGADYTLRRWLQDHGLGYVLTVTRAQRLGFGRVEDLAEAVPDRWLASLERRRRGQRAAALRLGLPAYGSDAAPGWEKGLLIRRCIAEPEKMTFYLTLAPDGSALADLVRVAGTRWTIEACFEAAKGEVGLDQYEVRSWTGWHRHVTLAMLAHAYLAAIRKVAVGGRGRRDLAPTCCRSPCRRCGGCFGSSSGRHRPDRRRRSPGRAGDAATSNAPDDLTGDAEPSL